MTVKSPRPTLAVIATTVLLAAGLLAGGATPASADCSSTEIYVEVLGRQVSSPTNGCVGPTSWFHLICHQREAGDTGGKVRVGVALCIAIPPN